MAGLSITRRRKAWLDGVVAGARGKGRCRLVLRKLKQIYERGLSYGKEHAATPQVQAMVQLFLAERDRHLHPRERSCPLHKPFNYPHLWPG